MKVVVLNAFPLNALPEGFEGSIGIQETDPETIVRGLIRESGLPVVSFIRHPASARLLGLEPSAGLAKLEPGDIAIVLTLANPARGQEVTEVTWADLRAWVIEVKG